MKNRQSSQVLRRKGFAASLKRNWGSYLLVAPFMLIFLVFTVAPVFVTLVISFTKYSVLEAPVFVGLENYKQLFLNDEVFAKAVRNTLIFAIFTGPVGYVLSFLASWATMKPAEDPRPADLCLLHSFYLWHDIYDLEHHFQRRYIRLCQ